MSGSFRVPGLWQAAVLVALADVSLRLFGLRRTLSVARWLGRRDAGPEQPGAEVVGLVARRVAQAAAFHPGRAQCLEQSLALYVLLRRRGVSSELRLGVRQSPFAAHAWVEHRGIPVNETEDFILQLTPFPSLGG